MNAETHKDHGDGMKELGGSVKIVGNVMKINRRSEALDALLTKRVKVTFKDGTSKEGILRFSSGSRSENYGVRIGRYYLLTKTGIVVFFKGKVKRAEMKNVRKN